MLPSSVVAPATLGACPLGKHFLDPGSRRFVKTAGLSERKTPQRLLHDLPTRRPRGAWKPPARQGSFCGLIFLQYFNRLLMLIIFSTIGIPPVFTNLHKVHKEKPAREKQFAVQLSK